MFQGLVNFSGTGASVLLVAYVIGGAVMLGAAFLPGNTALFRGVSGVLGLVLALWALKVLMFGGLIFLSAVVLLLPLVLLVRGVTATVGWATSRPSIASGLPGRHLPPARPHPATRQFTGMSEPGYHGDGMRTARVHQEYPAQPYAVPRQRTPMPAAPEATPARHRAS